jgi:hypothetical protein
LGSELGDLYVVQLDNGVPWAEANDDAPFPQAVQRKWRDISVRAPSGRPVYLALEPLAEDRETLAPPSEGSSLPRGMRGASFDDPAIIRAYTVYAQRAVRYFKPMFLNLGVENGELAHRRPGDWSAYVTLIEKVMAELRSEFPTLKMGISFGLQSLMQPATASRARRIVDLSDYVGLSFYPYMSSFQEKFGLPALPPPPDQWRAPLDWVRSFTTKPIAICETGYNTKDVDLPKWRIRMTGSDTLQADYVSDLGRYAARDRYLFVVYYLPVDIGALLDTLPEDRRAEGNMWRENGLLDGRLTPKPALDSWKSFVTAKYEPPAAAPIQKVEAPEVSAKSSSSGAIRVGFARTDDLCQAPEPAKVDLVDVGSGKQALQWEFPAGTKTWTWCSRPVPPGGFQRGTGMRFRIRSDVEGPVFLELKGAKGEAYFSVSNAGPEWRDVVLDWSDFAAEPNSSRSGALEPGIITSIVLADEGKSSTSQSRARRIWLTDWVVE